MINLALTLLIEASAAVRAVLVELTPFLTASATHNPMEGVARYRYPLRAAARIFKSLNRRYDI